MPLKISKLTIVEVSTTIVALVLLVTSTAVYVAVRPRVDFILATAPLACLITMLTAEYLSRRIKIDLTPLGSAPIAYALYYATSEYLRHVRELQTLSYSIMLGSTIAIITLTAILVTQKIQR